MRARLLAWLRNFIHVAGRASVLPRLRATADGMYEQLTLRWPETVVPDYPAFARPGSTPAKVPSWWSPEI